MNGSQDRFHDRLLRRQFEEEFRKGDAVRRVPRLIFYFVFCPIVIIGFLAAGLTFDRHYRIAGLIGGEVGIVIGLVAWVLIWGWAKKKSYRNWKRS